MHSGSLECWVILRAAVGGIEVPYCLLVYRESPDKRGVAATESPPFLMSHSKLHSIFDARVS